MTSSERGSGESNGSKTAVPGGTMLSKLVERVRNSAAGYVRDPAKSARLIARALKKAGKKAGSKGPLAEVWQYLMALVRLLQAYLHGEYTGIPWASVVSATAAVLYFVMPLDLIPDFIPVGGFIDDASVIAFVVAQIKDDLDRFLQWEAVQETGRD